MYNPLFSILIAQYNNGRFFEDCYNSIIAQTYTNWEVIIVDDCSTDDSLELMQVLIGDDPRFKIFRNDDNRGCGFTKKRCIDLANGELCGILDADDYLHEEALTSVVEQHLLRTDASIVYTSTVYFDSKGTIEGIHTKTSPQPTGISVLDESYISHFVSFKKRFYEISYGLSVCFEKAVDLDLYIVLDEVGEIVHLDHALYYYRKHDAGISQAKDNNAMDWAFIVRNYHYIRQKRFDIKHFNQIKQWYRYDLGLFSSWALVKVICRRIVNRIL